MGNLTTARVADGQFLACPESVDEDFKSLPSNHPKISSALGPRTQTRRNRFSVGRISLYPASIEELPRGPVTPAAPSHWADGPEE